jgi:hypothetical protein
MGVVRNDDPPHHEEALEIQVEGQFFAWDSDDNVYQYLGQGAACEREDGYSFVGKLAALDAPEYDPVAHLREFAAQHLKSKRASDLGGTDDPGGTREEGEEGEESAPEESSAQRADHPGRMVRP